jgi:3'-phosphoadenosine 5'-phosphosulfate sulfotransferase (PAPS reductase)/FAD synthetase
MLFSASKDSTVMAHVALRAFYPKVRFRTLGAAGP